MGYFIGTLVSKLAGSDLAEEVSATQRRNGAKLPSSATKPLFDAWGFERCLWGTDWTRSYAVVNYEQAVEPFLKTDRLSDSERAMLMGGACAKAYHWSPKKG